MIEIPQQHQGVTSRCGDGCRQGRVDEASLFLSSLVPVCVEHLERVPSPTQLANL
jgi:hypothetical protein